jgi:tryptophanyl-tRNA synthetase
LLLPFLSLVTLPELLRNPTVKDEASASGMTALNGLMLTPRDGGRQRTATTGP